jgi:hypothetical protein
MPLPETPIDSLASLIDRIIPDPTAREAAKLELLRLHGAQDLPLPRAPISALLAEARSTDPWASRARPGFLYVIYALLLWAIPMGLVAAAAPSIAARMVHAMTAYLNALPESLYALFGTGYLGYTAARQWGKVKGVER